MDSQINIKRSMEWKEFETTFSVKLNQQQKEAVQSTKGPVLLLAVPGSGKTTVLVTRLGYMIYCRNIPWKVMDSLLISRCLRMLEFL